MKNTVDPKNITVIGPSRWGSFLACYVTSIGHNVTLYGLMEAKEMIEFLEHRKSSLIWSLPMAKR